MTIRRLLLILGPCGALLAACPVSPTRAAPFTPSAQLDRALVADTAAVALAFVAPRALEPVSASLLVTWGLGGLARLDASLTTEWQGGQPSLIVAGRPTPAVSRPSLDDPREWGEALGRLSQAAWNGSEAVRRAGTPGVIAALLDDMLGHLDPYSRYLPPSEAAAERDTRRGRVELGLTLAYRAHFPVVARLAKGGPADIAGVRLGEQLRAIDGDSIEDAEQGDVEALLAGEDGSTVVLAMQGRDGPREVTVARELVVPRTVLANRLPDGRGGGVLLLRVSGFNRDTAASLGRELASAIAGPRPPAGIVLDLRGNRGGLLREATAAASTLLPAGPVARTVGRDEQANQELAAGGHDLAAGRPVVILVDGRTASAAEVLAAALADRGRAVVVGSTSFGKGLVQAITPLPDGGELMVSWRRVLAPLGWPIQSLGVVPQVCTSLGDARLASQLAELGRGHSAMAAAIARNRAARAPLPSAEAIEIRDACPPAEGRAPDLATARFLLDHPKAYAAAVIP